MKFNEVKVAEVNELKNGEMKAFSIGNGNKILLSKIDNEFSALAAYCTHYGAPLEEGALSGNTIVCPWHHACFNAKSGDLLEPPARDSLPKYEVLIKDNNVFVKVPEELEASRIPSMSKKDENEKSIYVIIGGGASGNSAAQAMREAGFKGSIKMITQEDKVPYDRPNLSKDYLQGTAEAEWMPLRPEDFYKEYGIEILFGKKVKSIDSANNNISFENGEDLKYDKLLIATGGTPRKLNIPGSDLKNIFYLRSFADSDEIINKAKDSKKAVVIGASFIAMESAHSLTERGLKVTVVAPEEIPFERVFGKEIGSLFKRQHEAKGVEFKLGKNVKSFEGSGSLKSVVLDNGEKIETDLVVVGIGVKPLTDFIKDISLQKDGSLKVDEHFKVNNNVYAAGDIAGYDDWRTKESIRIEHWRTAEQHGRNAGFNIAGKEIPFNGVPFFWTVQAGITLNYVGHAKEWDETFVDGNIDSQNFICYFLKYDKVYAAAGVNKDKELAAIEALMQKNKMPSASEIKSGKINLFDLLNK